MMHNALFPFIGWKIPILLIRDGLGGPLFGYIMAKITILWLSRVFNDAIVEISITLASTYVTFYIGDAIFRISGPLAVITLGLEINARRTNISPQVEVFLKKYDYNQHLEEWRGYELHVWGGGSFSLHD